MEHYSHPRAITALYREYQKRLRGLLKPIPVNAQNADYLRVVSNEPGITLHELSQKLGVSTPAVTQVIASLEKSGFIRRETDATDKRLRRLYLSEQGLAIELELNTVFDDFIQLNSSILTPEENIELERLLTKLYDALHEENNDDR